MSHQDCSTPVIEPSSYYSITKYVSFKFSIFDLILSLFAFSAFALSIKQKQANISAPLTP